jgi:diguanylate cyclase (GGDEF)-like protein
MRIDGPETRRRQALLGFTEDDAAVLASLRGLVGEVAEAVAADLVKALAEEMPAIRRWPVRAIRDHIKQMFGGHYGPGYANSRARAGRALRRGRVPLSLYLTALDRLRRLLADVIAAAGSLGSRRRAAEGLDALGKLTALDAGLVADAYLASATAVLDGERQRAENHAALLETRLGSDSLTDLYNHRAFYEHLRREIAAARRCRAPLSLVFMDVNDFKALNDCAGHLAGDKVLLRIGRALRACVRETDFPCRYGGDEFCILMPGTEVEQARQACERFLAALARQGLGQVAFSIGIVQVGPGRYLDAEAAVDRADALMYEAKRHSKAEGGGSHIRTEAPAPGLRLAAG